MMTMMMMTMMTMTMMMTMNMVLQRSHRSAQPAHQPTGARPERAGEVAGATITSHHHIYSAG